MTTIAIMHIVVFHVLVVLRSMMIMDDHGRILEANDRAVTTYGYSRDELLGMTVSELRHPSSKSDFARQWKEVSERGSLLFECLHQTRGGRAFPVEVSTRLIHVEENQFRQSIVRDISERKALDEKLRRMLDAHSAVIESSAAAIVSVTPDFRVTTWNKAAERIFGWTAEETLGGPWLFVPPDRSENARRLYERAMRGEVISGTPGWGQCKDGRIITLSISAAPLHDPDGRGTGIVLNFLDTTDQTTAEEALRRNEALFRATFDQAAVGMNFVSLDGHFLRVNPRFCQMVGYSEKELRQSTFQEITHPEDIAENLANLKLLAERKIERYQAEKRYIHKNGSIRWIKNIPARHFLNN